MIEAFQFLLLALTAVTLIASLGAIASRVFNFNYGYLSILSFLVYVAIGYFVSPAAGLNIAILVSLAVGFYDATIGVKISFACKANFGRLQDEVEKVTPSFMLTTMLFISPLLAFIGYLFI